MALGDYPQRFFNEENTLIKWTVPQRFKKEADDIIDPKVETALEGVEKEPEIQAILDGILPPREWSENNIFWRQKISPEPTTRMEVIKLSQRLDKNMAELDARESGICEIRRRLYAELFDEVIRQMTVNNPFLGKLLLKVRDDLKMTLLSLRCLCEDSVVFGVKKASLAEKGRLELQEIVDDLKKTTEQLEEEKKVALKSVVDKERKATADKVLRENLHIEQVENHEKINKCFKDLLGGVFITNVK